MPTPFTDEDLTQLIANYPDLFKSAGVGAAQGGFDVLGLRGDIADNALRGSEWLGRQVGLPESWIAGVRPYAQAATRFVAGPTSQDLQQRVEGVTGQFYEPQTVPGEVARKYGQRAVSLAAGGPLLKTMGAGTKQNLEQIRRALGVR